MAGRINRDPVNRPCFHIGLMGRGGLGPEPWGRFDRMRILRLRGCTVDLGRHLVEIEGVQHKIGSREADLLGYLAERPSQTVSREELLREVWGYSPDAITRVIDKAVCRLRALIGDSPSQPTHLITVQGIGYRFEPVSDAAVLLSTVSSNQDAKPDGLVSAAPRARSNLRGERTQFVGRKQDLKELSTAYEQGQRLVTLLGPPGAGKTRMAKEYALARQEAGDVVWFCGLADARTAGEVVAIIADEFQVSLAYSQDPLDSAFAIGAELKRRGEMLLIVDNFEQVVERAAQVVDTLLQRAPGLTVLVTSREALQLPGEVCFDVDPLPAEEAIELFMDRGVTQRRDLRGDPDTLEVVGQIVELLDGIPLAIELAAPLLRLLTPAQILKRLSDGLQVLRSRGRGVDRRQASLRGAVQWSWDLLDSWEQLALSQASVFRGSFSLEAAEGVIDLGQELDAPTVLDALASLRGKSLVHVVDGADQAMEFRLKMYEPVREFASEQLKLAGGTDAAVASHRAWFLAEGEKLARGMDQSRGIDSLTKLLLEKENLLAVHRQSSDASGEAVVRAALALDVMLSRRGPLEERLELLDAACDAARGAPSKWRGRAHLVRAEARLRRGGFEQVEEDIAIVRQCVEESGDRRTEARVLRVEGTVRLLQGRIEEAGKILDLAATLAGDEGDLKNRGEALGAKSAVLAAQGRKEEAHAQRRQAVEALSASGHRHGEVLQLAALALELIQIRNDDTGRPELVELLRTAWQVARQIGDRPAEAVVLRYRGLFHLDEGRLGQAEEDFNRCLSLQRRVGDLREQTMVLLGLATVHRLQGQLDEAERALRQTAELLRLVPDSRVEADVRAARVANMADLDEIDSARSEADRLVGQGAWQAHIRLAEARLLLSDDRDDEAGVILEQVRGGLPVDSGVDSPLRSSLPMRVEARLLAAAVERSAP